MFVLVKLMQWALVALIAPLLLLLRLLALSWRILVMLIRLAVVLSPYVWLHLNTAQSLSAIAVNFGIAMVVSCILLFLLFGRWLDKSAVSGPSYYEDGNQRLRPAEDDQEKTQWWDELRRQQELSQQILDL